MSRKAIDLATLQKKKLSGEKITMLTAYDAPTARALDAAGIDIILVGDSAANVVLGYPDTRFVSMDEMIVICSAVSRGNKYALVVGDMPFMSYNVSVEEAIRNSGRFIREARAEAVKMEGGGHVSRTVEAVVKAGIPVVGHLGLTPQTAGMIGGYHVQGKSAEAAARILTDAISLQDAGICMLVLECIPDRVARLISDKLDVPVIGIGAGADCDGQVLVVHDMLGIRAGFSPKFVKAYADLGERMQKAAESYRSEVEEGIFPNPEQSFQMDDAEFERLLALTEKG